MWEAWDPIKMEEGINNYKYSTVVSDAFQVLNPSLLKEC